MLTHVHKMIYLVVSTFDQGWRSLGSKGLVFHWKTLTGNWTQTDRTLGSASGQCCSGARSGRGCTGVSGRSLVWTGQSWPDTWHQRFEISWQRSLYWPDARRVRSGCRCSGCSLESTGLGRRGVRRWAGARPVVTNRARACSKWPLKMSGCDLNGTRGVHPFAWHGVTRRWGCVRSGQICASGQPDSSGSREPTALFI
jgi:hypothetical protein